MHAKQLLTVAVVAIVALSVVGPAAAADGLDVSVSQESEDVVVSVTENNTTAVADANVTVDGGNVSYREAGTYMTDDQGLVDLSAPAENVTVTVTATVDNVSASTTTELVAESVTANETDERDVNESDDRGADRMFDLDLDVTVDDGEVDHSNVTVNDSEPFGLYVGAFVQTVMSENVSSPMGQAVSSFVTEFNPGQGPPAYAGPPMNETERGPPEHAGRSVNGTERGPPEHAGPFTNGTERGPPEHAGPADNGTERGPPADVGQSANGTERGRPDNAGPADADHDRNDTEHEESGETGDDRRRGPPSHARGR